MKKSAKPRNAVAVVENPTAITPAKRGRPTVYDPKYIEEIIDYFSVPPYESKTTETYYEGRLIPSEQKEASDFPSLAGFAIQIGVNRSTLREWSEKYPEFSAAYKRAIDFQERWLVVNGLRGLVPPAFGIFTAKNVIGWRDRQPGETDIVINNYANKSEDEIDAEIAERQKRLSGENT